MLKGSSPVLTLLGGTALSCSWAEAASSSFWFSQTFQAEAGTMWHWQRTSDGEAQTSACPRSGTGSQSLHRVRTTLGDVYIPASRLAQPIKPELREVVQGLQDPKNTHAISWELFWVQISNALQQNLRIQSTKKSSKQWATKLQDRQISCHIYFSSSSPNPRGLQALARQELRTGNTSLAQIK